MRAVRKTERRAFAGARDDWCTQRDFRSSAGRQLQCQNCGYAKHRGRLEHVPGTSISAPVGINVFNMPKPRVCFLAEMSPKGDTRKHALALLAQGTNARCR